MSRGLIDKALNFLVVHSCSRKGHAFTMQKHVGDLVHGLSGIDVTPERGCAA